MFNKQFPIYWLVRHTNVCKALFLNECSTLSVGDANSVPHIASDNGSSDGSDGFYKNVSKDLTMSARHGDTSETDTSISNTASVESLT